jgi:hypothetical protein
MGGESGPCRKSLRARREVQVGQEGDSSMTWSNRERMGDRVGERVTEQCKLKWDGMVPPTRIERATRGLGNSRIERVLTSIGLVALAALFGQHPLPD